MKCARADRILVVLHDLPLGGSERIAIRLANRWAEAGRAVTLLCGARRGPLEALIGPGVEVLECAPPIPRAKGSRRALGEAAAAFLATKPHDILFVCGNYHWPIMPHVAAMPQAHRPAIVAQAGTPLYRPGRGSVQQVFYNLRTRRQFQGVERAIALSTAMGRDVDRVLGRRITDCINLPALEDDDGAARMPARGRTILAAGRLEAVKGFDVAIRAFARLGDLSSRLVILGDGSRRGDLEELAVELGVAGRVEFPGYVADIRPYLERARVFLLSSRYEGYGAVVLEALDAGRPVVATACTPAAEELLADPRTGAVVPVGDIAAMAQALGRVMDAPTPDPRVLAGAVAAYRIGPISQAYLDLFDTALPSRTPAWVRFPELETA